MRVVRVETVAHETRDRRDMRDVEQRDSHGRDDLNLTSEVLCAEFVVTEESCPRSRPHEFASSGHDQETVKTAAMSGTWKEYVCSFSNL